MRTNKPRVLIVFNAGAKAYGMERAVIETFDLLKPEVDPHFLMSYTTKRLDLPILREIKERDLSHSFLSDWADWPRIGKPKSLREAWTMSIAMVRGNFDVLKAARGKDYIYIPGINYFYFTLLAAIFHRLRGKGIIFHFHDLVSTPSVRLRFTSWFVTDFIHNTSYGREAVTKSNPFVDRAKNWIIPSPVLRAERSELSDNASDFERTGQHILFVGQVAGHKGIDMLLNAFSLLRRSHKDIKLHIVGGCDNADLKTRINGGSSGNSGIRYWGYRDDVLRIMKLADILVPPSPSATNESFGRVVTEAMSVGTPTVCFRSGALPEIVAHEETGLICEAETAESLACNIERMLTDDQLRERCGLLALSRFEEFYSPARVKIRWLQVVA